MAQALKLDRFMPYRLSVAANRVSDAIAQAYARLFGLRIPEWRVIAVLAEEAPVAQLALVARTAMDKMSVSRAVRPLVARGLIERLPNNGDGRSHLLRLSREGRALYAQVAPAALRLEQAVLAGFSETEIETLMAALRRLETTAAAIAEG